MNLQDITLLITIAAKCMCDPNILANMTIEFNVEQSVLEKLRDEALNHTNLSCNENQE
jgi:hypothetical protein